MGEAHGGRSQDHGQSTFLSCAHLADEIPVESRQAILDCGYTFWTQWDQLNTTRCAVLFDKQLGVPRVSFSFTFYRNAFLFALAVRWDIDVACFDLIMEQSIAAFGFVNLIQRAARPNTEAGNSGLPHRSSAGPQGAADGQRGDGGAEAAHAGVPEHDVPDKYAMTKANVRAVRKQAGASRWVIRLGRMIEHILEAPPLDLHVQMGDIYGDVGPPVASYAPLEMAAEMCEIVLKTEDGAQAPLKDKYRAAKERAKKKEKKARKREKQARKGTSGKRSYSLSASSSSSSGSSSDSSMERVKPTAGKARTATVDYQRFFEATQEAPGAPAFIWIKGEPHFRSRNSGDLINCSRPPKTPCKVCGHAHWYWQGMAHGCKGQFARKA